MVKKLILYSASFLCLALSAMPLHAANSLEIPTLEAIQADFMFVMGLESKMIEQANPFVGGDEAAKETIQGLSLELTQKTKLIDNLDKTGIDHPLSFGGAVAPISDDSINPEALVVLSEAVLLWRSDRGSHKVTNSLDSIPRKYI